MHTYRSHNCNELRADHIGQEVKLSGWINRKRDHGGVLFIDLRDTHGITQCVIDEDSPVMAQADSWRTESVVTLTGKVRARAAGTTNSKMASGDIEIYVTGAEVQSMADVIPFQVAEDDGAGEDIRLKYRYLDLRREKMQRNIRLRNDVIASIRKRMWDQDFQEFQTPELTASSPEGARDYLVPSRLHPGKFYALPQSPQQFKQLLMVSGFDKYFQIAPCFRDEDGRADRLPVHYQLDVEMSFVTQDDIHNTMSSVIKGVFEEFSDWTGRPHKVEWLPSIPYEDAMLKYGSDKPDLRNPLEIVDVTDVFSRDDVEFKAFKGIIEKGGVVRAIRAPNVGDQPRSFFDKLNSWAQSEGAFGLGYILFADGEGKGPIAKFVPAPAQEELKKVAALEEGDAVFFICDQEAKAAAFAGKARTKIAQDMDIIEKDVFKLCWIIDFPMYEMNEETGKVDFSHNPFSMPQGGLDDLNNKDPLDIYAWQYDMVCNGYELCSGAIRNHRPDIMEKAFAIAGHTKEDLEAKFSGMLNALKFGAPPHGGTGIGIDRIIMLLANEPNLREVNAFTYNGNGEDPLMNAPSAVSEAQLKDLHIKLSLPKEKIKQEAA